MVLMIQLFPNTTDLRETFPNVVYQAFGDASGTGTAPR
jgi:hypothetical protein